MTYLYNTLHYYETKLRESPRSGSHPGDDGEVPGQHWGRGGGCRCQLEARAGLLTLPRLQDGQGVPQARPGRPGGQRDQADHLRPAGVLPPQLSSLIHPPPGRAVAGPVQTQGRGDLPARPHSALRGEYQGVSRRGVGSEVEPGKESDLRVLC